MHMIFGSGLALGLNLQVSIVLKTLCEQGVLLDVNLTACLRLTFVNVKDYRTKRGVFIWSYPKMSTPGLTSWFVELLVIQSHIHKPQEASKQGSKKDIDLWEKKKSHFEWPVNHRLVCSESVSPALRRQPMDSSDNFTEEGFQTECKLAPSPWELTSWIKDPPTKYWLLSVPQQFVLHFRRAAMVRGRHVKYQMLQMIPVSDMYKNINFHMSHLAE